MRIYTSYYGNARKLQASGIAIINVALWKPRFIKTAASLPEVAPTAWMVRQATDDEYRKAYAVILQGIDPQGLLEKIRQISQGRDAALCCYEKPGEFCHRHLLARFLSRATGERIEEYSPPDAQQDLPGIAT